VALRSLTIKNGVSIAKVWDEQYSFFGPISPRTSFHAISTYVNTWKTSYSQLPTPHSLRERISEGLANVDVSQLQRTEEEFEYRIDICEVVRKLQRGLSCTETWCEHWNFKINEEKTRGIYFPRSRRPPETHLTLNGRNIPFVNIVKYLGVIFDKKVIWRLHILVEIIEAKAFRTFIRIYSLFKSEQLSTNIKLTLHKALIRSNTTYAGPAWEFAADNHLLKLQRLQNKVLRTIGKFPSAYRFAICIWLSNFRIYIYDYITKLCRQQAEVIQNHENVNVRNIGQGEPRHRKYKRHQFGGSQAYDRSSD
jgi:hypothetical protein